MGPIKTTVLLKGGYMGFHVNLGECTQSLKAEHAAYDQTSCGWTIQGREDGALAKD